MKNVEIRVTDNIRQWKQKEFNRLFPNSLFYDYDEMAWHFNNYQGTFNFNLRKFKNEYKEDA